MSQDSRLFISVVIATALLVAAAGAQATETASLTAAAGPTYIRLTIILDVPDPQPEWVGWLIYRDAVGICGSTTLIQSQHGFPAPADTITFDDTYVESGVTYEYRLLAKDGDGHTYNFGEPPVFNPAYERIAYAAVGEGRVARGQLQSDAGNILIDLCPGQCWETLSFVSDVSPELNELVGSGATVELFGELAADFEGPYVSQITRWQQVVDCNGVADETLSWGALKRSYR